MDPGFALHQFLQPLRVDSQKIHALSRLFYANFKHLALNAEDQFLATPISESILRPVSHNGHGRHLAIDIGGTNLRVGFVELEGKDTTIPDDALSTAISRTNGTSSTAPALRLKEKSWPIDDRLKTDSEADPQLLFDWIGARIAEVVRSACEEWQLPAQEELPLGITFSFPMVQHSISDATVMTMGKGFSIGGDAELGPLLLRGYEKSRVVDDGDAHRLPPIRIAAISNDSVSTLISFIYLFNESHSKKASMGLIVGTGCNATIPLRLTAMGSNKWPANVSTLPGESAHLARIAVNTEWSIRGTAPPMRELHLITPWDSALDAALVGPNEIAGFQPLEYMTAGRYLGELGRLILVDYLKTVLAFEESSLPKDLLVRYRMTTTFLSHFKPSRPSDPSALLAKLENEFPADEGASFQWTPETAVALYHIAKAIQVRAAGIVAAATVALLKLAGDIPEPVPAGADVTPVKELGVGYTGGCISHFQDYLADTQDFLDKIVRLEYHEQPPPVRVVLSPCHDGGIKGAGILAAATGSSQTQETQK
ncbi:hexokinase-1 [Colletotrichum graminicola]|uniref:Phosphotransferase n=1 Tax=Colletotrichum graminicola (strain M1.001 / M2 / FGSC 10212) TaxID=645133 RepID=E3QMI3_COLGM|nr:hexokinase-1 [Colletotrichum graminicola M1.001]EFQ32071.1 hexokinase-1 [Colletotrichum graminicola M1.001]WDK17044.1 hexokinase-1 [Colletotrichum graminicola]